MAAKSRKQKIKETEKALQMVYRLPSQYKWEYALSLNDTKTIDGSKKLHQIEKGDQNKLYMLNLNSNVSEWTSSSDIKDNDNCKVVNGNSWKSNLKDAQCELVSNDIGTDYIGLRIVRSEIIR